MTKPFVSIIIPCYNEREYIRDTAMRVLDAFSEKEIEIVIVDDGSHDGSYDVLLELQKEEPRVRALKHEKNRGKGAAIRTGIAAANGDTIGFIDGDGEVDPQYLVEAVTIVRESDYVDIVIGNRYIIPNGYKTTSVRRLYSHVYRVMNWLLFSLPWKDTQAGLKAFRAAVAKTLFSASDIQGYAFDIDILAHAHLVGLRVEELPISQILKGQSTITKKHILHMIIDTVATYRRFMRDEWSARTKQNPAALFPFLGRQLLALPTALAAWLCAKLGLLVLSKMHRQ